MRRMTVEVGFINYKPAAAVFLCYITQFLTLFTSLFCLLSSFELFVDHLLLFGVEWPIWPHKTVHWSFSYGRWSVFFLRWR